MAVDYTIGKYVEGSTVSVVFVDEEAGITHQRSVNAVFNSKGKYDAKATEERVKEVARGVEHKISVGAIVPTPPAEEPEG